MPALGPAIALYRRHGYQSIPCLREDVGNPSCVCFGKALADPSGAVPPTRIG